MQGPDGKEPVPLVSGTFGGLVEALSDDELKKRIETAASMPANLTELFTYHEATPEQRLLYAEIRQTAMILADVIDRNCPAGPDRTTAVRCVREAVMWANACIATGNAQYR